ncbi:MAG: hypothetical protein BGN86_02660 [Caulobacterales bacterium 68-7]|nr:hypothetical protein [Caulobacterales bacterium]OJU08439.1 MAG: hypothetical protein BGN86_02660 [Caulobacterales bacterium 68-7]
MKLSKGLAAATALTLAAGVFACGPKESPEVTRAHAIMAGVSAKAPGAAFGKVWANGPWTCGRFTVDGVEKGFLGKTVDVLWIEGPDTRPYYDDAWHAYCSMPKTPLF